MRRTGHEAATHSGGAGQVPNTRARPQKTDTDSGTRDEPSRKQQDGNLYPPVAVATPIRHEEESRGSQHMGDWDEGGNAEKGSWWKLPLQVDWRLNTLCTSLKRTFHLRAFNGGSGSVQPGWRATSTQSGTGQSRMGLQQAKHREVNE